MHKRLTTREIVTFALLGALMYCGFLLMQWIPNVHPVAMLVMVYTVIYRKKALYPIYVYVFLCLIISGFALSMLPYLYIWTILWGIVMLLPRNLPAKFAVPMYMIVCALFGLAFGTLYAPMQALMFHYTWKGMLAWIAAGFSFDVIHAIGNFAAGSLVIPISKLLQRYS